MDNLKEKSVKAFIWQFFNRIATHGMGFIISIFLARLLEPSDFGLIAMIMVIFGLATVFTDVGLGAALIQRKRLHSVHYSSVFYFNVFVGILLTVVTYFSAPWISEFYANEQLTSLTQAMSVLFVITSFSSVQNTLLHKELNYALLTKIGLFSSLISGIIGVVMAFMGAGVWSLVAQLLINGILHNILVWSFAIWLPSFMFSWKALTQLWAFGFRMFLSGMLDSIFTRLDFLIIGKLFTPSTLGYLQRAKSLNNMVVQYSSGSIMTVLFPVLSKVKNDLLRFQNIILKTLGIICFVIFLLLGGLYLVSEELIVLLFTDKWLPSVILFKILVLSGFGHPIGALLVNILKSRGDSKGFLRLEIYKKIIMSLNFIVLYYAGINAYLYGLIITSTLGVLLNILFAAREIKLPFYLFVVPIIVQAIIATFSVIITLLSVANIEVNNLIFIILIKGSVFFALYILINYLLNTSSFSIVVEQVKPFIRKKLTSL